jgi:hypothetical protein
MRALGVWCKKEEVLFAVADDGRLVDDDHRLLHASPALLEASEALQGTQDDVGRVIAEVAPDVVRILQPEQRYEGSYISLAPRVTLETLVRLAAVRAGVPVEMLHRATARARVGVPQKGKLETHVPKVFPAPVGKYWARGRQLAAIAAVAEP